MYNTHNAFHLGGASSNKHIIWFISNKSGLRDTDYTSFVCSWCFVDHFKAQVRIPNFDAGYLTLMLDDATTNDLP